jgi:hypothetical protein
MTLAELRRLSPSIATGGTLTTAAEPYKGRRQSVVAKVRPKSKLGGTPADKPVQLTLVDTPSTAAECSCQRAVRLHAEPVRCR